MTDTPATPDLITGKRRDRVAIRTEDLDEETLALILKAEPGERSTSLNHLTDETEND